jgi:hypothetical protein
MPALSRVLRDVRLIRRRVFGCHRNAQDTITGFLLAGVGNVDLRRKSNFLIVDQSAP